jgi:hypothetical protein
VCQALFECSASRLPRAALAHALYCWTRPAHARGSCTRNQGSGSMIPAVNQTSRCVPLFFCTRMFWHKNRLQVTNWPHQGGAQTEPPGLHRHYFVLLQSVSQNRLANEQQQRLHSAGAPLPIYKHIHPCERSCACLPLQTVSKAHGRVTV